LNKVLFGLGILILLTLTACAQPVNNNYMVTYKYDLSYRNKTENCTYNYPYQDFDCSPGHTFPLTALKVNGKYAKEPGTAYVGDICEVGYSASVRDVSQKLKNQVYLEYKIYKHEPYEYEIDHIIPLILGGDNDIANLYPQPMNPKPGYKQKDTIEKRLNKMVCAGEITLEQAQYDIAYNWTKYVK
jgi:hypothetical protein